jgi:hypothetical protein
MQSCPWKREKYLLERAMEEATGDHCYRQTLPEGNPDASSGLRYKSKYWVEVPVLKNLIIGHEEEWL